ncbi:unnamed protein product [Durusdinium trenchii]|uniref:Uncharacterized protein n=1 Tax=Durusdinium trenchii TaxID=1381693 RepID=A0ABP0LXL4_9DINO
MESPVATTFVVGTVAIYISYVYWLGATGPLAAFLSLQSKKTDDPDQIKIEQVLLRIHNKRCSAWVAGTALSSLCSEMYCIFLLVQSQFRGGIEDIAYSLHFWTAFSSAVLTRWASKPGGKTSRQQTMMLSILINLLGLLNSVDLSNHLMAANYLGRAFIGSFSPDIWFTVRVNFYLLPAFVACGYVRQGPERDLSILPILFVNEVVSVVFMAVILGQLNYLTIRQEQSTMELEESLKKEEIRTKDTESILKAAKGLLAVMCDCCEQLSHNWEVLQPSNKILEMFRISGGKDQDRFTHFMDTSQVDAVSSLHLRMQDHIGGSLDVQLFHMPVPSGSATGLPQHLVGFNVKDLREPRPLRRDIPSIPEGEVLMEDCASVSSSEETTHSSQSQSSRRLKAQVENMSVASRDPAGFLGNVLQHVNSVEQVKLILDLHSCQEGYAIREMAVSFKEAGPGISPLYFYKLLKKRCRAVVEDFIQEHVNCFYHGIDSSERCTGTKMKIPSMGAIMVGEMTVQDIRFSEEQFHLELNMRNFVAKK